MAPVELGTVHTQYKDDLCKCMQRANWSQLTGSASQVRNHVIFALFCPFVHVSSHLKCLCAENSLAVMNRCNNSF